MRTIFFTIILSFILFLLSYNVTHSYFTDSAVSGVNTFSAASEFPTETLPIPSPTGTQLINADVVINEVYPHGDSEFEWVELYNRSDNEVNVTGWKISESNSYDYLPTVVPIPAGGYAVILSSSNLMSIPSDAIKIQLNSPIGSGLGDVNEVLYLSLPNDTVIDAVNWGTYITYFSPSINSPAMEKTISRNSNGADTNTAADWNTLSSGTPGLSN